MLHWLVNSLRGVCMGIADVIPGVSGGTLALILGIYERFIAAVSAVGPRMLRLVFKKAFWSRFFKGMLKPDELGDDEIGEYAGHALFLSFLVLGIGAAILVGARFIPTLLDLYPAQMKGFFFGLVLASVIIPFRHMKQRGVTQIAALVVFALGTFILVDQPADQSQKARGQVVLQLAEAPEEAIELRADQMVFMTSRHGGESEKREVAFGPPSDVVIPAGATTLTLPVVARMSGAKANLEPGQVTVVHGGPEGATVSQPGAMAGGVDPALWFIFIAGFIAISAMVLPGISGSFILLLLGLYHYMTFNLRELVYERDGDALVVVGVFIAALVAGILVFSRVLRWLLSRYHDTTMAALVGIMLGSLNKLWPFVQTAPGGETLKTLPDSFDGSVGATLGTFVLGVVIVLLLDRFGSRGDDSGESAAPA